MQNIPRQRGLSLTARSGDVLPVGMQTQALFQQAALMILEAPAFCRRNAERMAC